VANLLTKDVEVYSIFGKYMNFIEDRANKSKKFLALFFIKIGAICYLKTDYHTLKRKLLYGLWSSRFLL